MADTALRVVSVEDRECFSNTTPDHLRSGDDPSSVRSGSRSPACADLDLLPVTAPRPVGSAFGRWLLDLVVVSFAHGGCIHHTHPDYVAFLRDLNGPGRRSGRP